MSNDKLLELQIQAGLRSLKEDSDLFDMGHLSVSRIKRILEDNPASDADRSHLDNCSTCTYKCQRIARQLGKVFMPRTATDASVRSRDKDRLGVVERYQSEKDRCVRDSLTRTHNLAGDQALSGTDKRFSPLSVRDTKTGGPGNGLLPF